MPLYSWKAFSVSDLSMEEPPRSLPWPSVHEFHSKMHRTSRIFVYIHAVISAFGAVSYTVVSILITSEWRTDSPSPVCPMLGGFTANLVLLNLLAVTVNISLCFAAVLLVGFQKCKIPFVKIWFWGQFFVEFVVTGVLVSSIILNCKLVAILCIPPFLYFVVALSGYRQISAAVSYHNNYALK